MKRAGYLLVMIIFMMNASLMLAGSLGFDFGITSSNFTSSYKNLPSGLQDLNAPADFQNNLVLTDDQNTQITDTNSQTASSVSTDLTFLSPFSILGSFFTLFLFAFDMILNATFGITLVTLKLGFPIEYVIFIGLFNFMVVSLAAFELSKDFIGARGGVR